MNKSKNSLKKQKGITLVALVITVIVLLILAGVSISLVVGNNGVLTQASNAVIESRKAKAKEEVEMAWASVESDYWTEWTKDSSIQKNFSYYNPRLAKYLGIGIDKITEDGTNIVVEYNGWEFIIDSNGNVVLNLEGNSTGNIATGDSTGSGTGENENIEPYTVTFLKNKGDTILYATTYVAPEETIESNNMPQNPTKANRTFIGWKDEDNDRLFTSSTPVKSNIRVYADWRIENDPTERFGTANSDYISDFGKKVAYSGYSNYASTDEWRLFYADSHFAYLISNPIGNYRINDTSIVTGFGTSTISTLAQNLNPNFTSWNLTTNGNLNDNIKGVAALLDSSKWTGYKSSDAEWAVGAPPLEMFIASYNATHTSTFVTSYNNGHSEDDILTSKQLYCNVENSTSTGYRIKIENGDYDYNPYATGLGNSSLLDNAIFCSTSFAWFLASPNYYYEDGKDVGAVWCIGSDYSGTCGWGSVNDDSERGLRPLVCIPIELIGTGEGQISILDSY